MKNSIFSVSLYLSFAISPGIFAQQTIRQYLSGTGSDQTVDWDFYCTGGRKSGEWTKIPVPSCWEQQGFGEYNYGHDKQKAGEKGLYKTSFIVPGHFKNQIVFIVFEGSMTDTEVKINNQSAGPVHQGAFNRFKYDITRFVKMGNTNILEVEVSKMSANKSVNDAERSCDYWIFGGIYRPVYLEVVPDHHIERVAIDARADGSISADVFCNNLKKGERLEAEVFSADGRPAGPAIIVSPEKPLQMVRLTGKYDAIKPWSAEFPDLYKIRISILDKDQVIHQAETKFGFRTIEVREGEGIYVNGSRVILKGVNRHSTNVETGKTLSKAISIKDVNLIREMNMNAVRMSHYSPDDHFLDACDSIGLYVLDELAGWQKAYDDIAGPVLVKELVGDDVNHPSILFWDNGNEGGWNRNLVDDFALYDPQKRTVIHPWDNFNGLNTKHYPDFNMVQNTVLYGSDIYMPTEFMHGLYDGGHGAGLEDFWNLMMQHRCLGGGFLWVFQDEGINRTDKGGIIDTDSNHAPDGILGPGYEKEASFFTIKEIWSPIVINRKTIPSGFDGRIWFENRYSFTNASQCTFRWKLSSFPFTDTHKASEAKSVEGFINSPDVPPDSPGILNLQLPENWQSYDALYLTAIDPRGNEIFTWSWPLKNKGPVSNKLAETTKVLPEVSETDSTVTVISSQIKYKFSKKTGYLERIETLKGVVPFYGGPQLAGAELSLTKFETVKRNHAVEISASYSGKDRQEWMQVKWIIKENKEPEMEYIYKYSEARPYMGISFNLPEEELIKLDYLGRGPYRVWKNRLLGTQFGWWEKTPNNTITGESYDYPELPGYYADVRQVVFLTRSGNITISTPDEGMFLQLYRPADPVGAYNTNTSPTFPQGDIGFLDAISPIGTKFQATHVMGPQSQLNSTFLFPPKQGVLYFRFE